MTTGEEAEREALGKRGLDVPGPEMRDEPPTGEYQLASHYLLESARLKRRETTVDVYLADVGARTIDVECSLPSNDQGPDTWYLPLAYFPKEEVAPDLEVTTCDGQIVAIPTKQQNLALTKRAIGEMIDDEDLEIDLKSAFSSLNREVTLNDVKEFFAEVIRGQPIFARGHRLAYEELEGSSEEVAALMRRFEDNFVLWVPAEGKPQSHHHFRIRRREIRPRDQIVAPKLKSATWEYESALGPIEMHALSARGHRWLRFKSLFGRLPNTVAVRPIETRPVDLEARRAGSCHMRVNAPPGFLVRNVRAGKLLTPREEATALAEAQEAEEAKAERARWRRKAKIKKAKRGTKAKAGEYSMVVELKPEEEEVVIQGWEQNLAHVHVFEKENPGELHCFVTIGPRGGAITLWMVAAVFTAVLLWAVYHAFKMGAPAPVPPEHFEQFVSTLGERRASEDEYLPISSTGKQILAGVLLVGPAFASAWSLRADGGEMTRSFFAGAQLFFLTSAALSVFTALALTGVVKDTISTFKVIEWCAAISYVVATPLIGGWLLTRSTLWVLFRYVFKKKWPNVAAVVVLAVALVVAGWFKGIPDGCTGVIVAVSGMALALIGANSAAEDLRGDRSGDLYRSVAGFGSIPVILLAGSFLGFYGRLPFPFVEDPRIWCIVLGGLVGLTPIVAWGYKKLKASSLGRAVSRSRERMRREKKNESPVVGPTLPDGIWEITPRPADALDDARITALFQEMKPKAPSG